MFNEDFYPTPAAVIAQMLEGEDLQDKVIFEPSAGKGDIVDALSNAKEVLVCEKNADLRKILQTKCKVIAEDFLTVTSDQVSHVSYIVMNPPFSNATEHILKAWEIAPPGCKIIAVCNVETIDNPYSMRRKELKTIVESYGFWQPIGSAFSQAERRTDVEVALIKFNKPGADYSTEFAGFFTEEEPEAQANGLIHYNVVRDLVNRYIGAVKIFDRQLETAVQLNELTASFFTTPEVSISVTRDTAPVTRSQYKKELQKSGWNWIFREMNLQKYATRGLKEDINKFVETQENIPFTMGNIYKMLEIVIGTTSQRMDKAILEVFDQFTKHHHENRHGVEGWQTNSHYLLNRRFIVGGLVSVGWHGEPSCQWQNGERLDDLTKALCYLTGVNYDGLETFYDTFRRNPNTVGGRISATAIKWGEWNVWEFFRMKPYKKGSVHFEFKDENVWATFNARVSKLKGYPLPEKKERTKWQQQRQDKQDGVKRPAAAPTTTHQVIATIQL